MKELLILLLSIFSLNSQGQVSGSFVVNGDINTYYPVTFIDGGWHNNVATNLKLGRSSVHTDAEWLGSFLAEFSYHVNNWGNGAAFIDANITRGILGGAITEFVAGWVDATNENAELKIVIWLRGGTTTYYYQSNYAVTPTVYDGVQNASLYQETATLSRGPVTSVASYVNPNGHSFASTFSSNGTGNNFFNGNVGIGTRNPAEKLAVDGTILSKKVKVTQTGWADYVFYPSYRLAPLYEVEAYIKQNQHLPEIPSAAEVEKTGVDLGDNQAALLKKIEELTLYAIQQQKEIDALKGEIRQLVRSQHQ